LNGYGRGANQNNHDKSVITRETIGMTFLIFSVILFIIATIGRFIFGEIGEAITSVFVGLTGMLFYPLLVLAMYSSVCMVAGRSFLPVRWLVRVGAVVLSAFLIVHLATSVQYLGKGYGAYLGGCWNHAEGITGGGVLYGLIVYPVQALLSQIGAYILFAVVGAVSVFFLLWKTPIKNLFFRREKGAEPKPVRTEQKITQTEQKPVLSRNPQEMERPSRQTVGHNPSPNIVEESVGYRAYQGEVYSPTDAGNRFDRGTFGGQGQADGYARQQNPVPPVARVGYYGEHSGLVGYYGPREQRVQPYEEPQNSGNEWVNGILKKDNRGKSGGYYGPQNPATSKSGRDVLFSGASNDYFRNLIYSDDSYFNTRQRRSSVQPVEPSQARTVEPTVTERPAPQIPNAGPTDGYDRGASRAPESYLNRYSEQAERREMPRKIVEQRPEQSSLRGSDLNYPEISLGDNRENWRDARRERLDSRERSESASRELLRSRFDEPREELPRSRFDEPKEELPRSRFDETKEELPRSRFDEPREELPRSRFDETREELPRSRFDEPREELPRSRFDEPKEELPRSRFDEPKEELPRSRFDEPKEAVGEPQYEIPKLEVPEYEEPKIEVPEYTEPQPEEPKAESGEQPKGDEAAEDDWKERERSYRNLFSQSSGEDRIQLKQPSYDFFTERMNQKKAERERAQQAQENFETEQTEQMQPSEPLQPTEEEPPRGVMGFGEPSRAERLLDRNISRADLFDDDSEEPVPQPPAEVREEAPLRSAESVRTELTPSPAVKSVAEEPKSIVKRRAHKRYKYPPLDIFRSYDSGNCINEEEIRANSDTIIETLAGFRVEAKIKKVTVGPSVTRYDIDIPRNIAVRSVIKYDEEIAMRLRATNGVNMYSNAEIGAISIEVPNSKRATVGIGSIMNTPDYREKDPHKLTFVIGRDVEGRAVCRDIVKMTHVLVAGATNSGKSVCLNAMLISLICKYSPDDLRIILIDPKKIEFAPYEGLPHLMINEIISDTQKVIMSLNWAVKEMERRYALFETKTRSGCAVRNIDEFNDNRTEEEEKLAKIVIVVDELADLMSVAKKEIEERIQRLTQKARAAGIHLVLATQRPSVDVITGVIKGNLPTRMAFRVAQEVDSRTILDETGAQKLLGNGDMLFKTSGMFGCLRVQGAFVHSNEVDAVVNWIKENNEAYFDPEVADYINRENEDEGTTSGDDSNASVGEEYLKALEIVVNLGQASISLLQRKCAIGYNHAGKIIEWMEMMGYISRFDGKAKARTVLLTKEEYESKYGSLN